MIFPIVLSALLLIGTVAAKPQWRDDVDGRYYMIEREAKYNWFEAFHECGRLGLNLVEIDSEEKNQAFKQLMKKVFGKPINIWIGGNDHYNTAKDKQRPFYLLSSGKKMEFTYWNAGEPNNERGEEHCVHIDSNSEDFKWNDIQCNNHKHGLVCELHSIGKIHDDFLSEKRRQLRKIVRKAFQEYERDHSKVVEQLQQKANAAEGQTKELQAALEKLAKTRDEVIMRSIDANYEGISTIVNETIQTIRNNDVDVKTYAEKARRDYIADSEDVKDIVDDTIAGHAPYRNRKQT